VIPDAASATFPGHVTTAVAPAPRKKPPRQTRKKGGGGQPRTRLLTAAEAETATQRSTAPLNIDPADAMAEALDAKVQSLRYAQKQVDAIPLAEMWRDTMVGKVEHEWIKLRNRYLNEVFAMGAKLASLGIDERHVMIQEAKAVMMVSMVKQAAERSGLTQKQVAALGRELKGIVAEQAQLGAGS
jgi:hypothetical protein